MGLSALAALGAGGMLTGCASDLAGSGKLPLPRPNNPVKWPVFADNTAIKSGLTPEKDATQLVQHLGDHPAVVRAANRLHIFLWMVGKVA